MNWKDKALEILSISLTPVPHELSELDWKSGLSSKTDRLAQHVCAFSNHQGGGMTEYGICTGAEDRWGCLPTVLMMMRHSLL